MRSVVSLLTFVACGAPTPAGGAGHDALATVRAAPSPSPAARQGEASDAIAIWNDGQITRAEFDEQLGSEVRAMQIRQALDLYEMQVRALEGMALNQVLEAEAQRRGLGDVRALLAAEVEAKIPEPTDDDLQALYRMMQRMLNGASFEAARPRLVEEWKKRAGSERQGEYLASVQEAAGVKIYLPYPDIPRIDVAIAEHDPIRGDVGAPVTVVQFAEYQCYYCGVVAPTLDRLMKDYDGKVRLVFKDFPLREGGASMAAAVAAHCAGEQGEERYWGMNHLLLDNQRALAEADLARYGADLGLDAVAFQSCVTSGRYESLIREDLDEGRQAGVSATPTFFINGLMVSGALPYDRFAAVIDSELASDEPR